ncbi:hypothetical protein [Pseudonocardia sp. GCM10023141]|uniref:hypothetical protein n=1 Tax=Pseudonocardia sp. GCM10023141 TaxID=3252653 RepID=UPI00361A7FF1
MPYRLNRLHHQLSDEYAQEIHDLRSVLQRSRDSASPVLHWAVMQAMPDADRDERIAFLRERLEHIEAQAYRDGLHPDPVLAPPHPSVTAAQDQGRAATVAWELNREREQRGEIEPDVEIYGEFADDTVVDDHVEAGDSGGAAGPERVWDAIGRARHAVDAARASTFHELTDLDTTTRADTDPDDRQAEDTDEDGSGWPR